MVEIESRVLGKVEVSDDMLFRFDKGLLGFEDYKDFYLLNMGDDKSFSILQSNVDKDICFILVDPFTIFSDYSPEVHDDDVNSLGIKDKADLLLLAIVTIRSTPESSMTANLLGPVIFNTKNHKSKQCITEGDNYSTRHSFILAEVKEVKEDRK